MSGENKLRVMQEEYNGEETRSAQTYEKEFIYRVLSRELIDPDISRCNRNSYKDTLVATIYPDQDEREFFVALRKHTSSHNNDIFNYVRIATDHQCDKRGNQTVKILTLPLENVNAPPLIFQHIQCVSINKDFCRINVLTTTEADEDFPLSYKVNLKNGHVKRLAHQRITHGYSAIHVYYNYSGAFPQSISEDILFLERKDFKPLPVPLIWNEQTVFPQKLHR